MITSGANYAKMTYIISDKYELIRAELVAANFGGTVVDSFGMFSDDRRQMLMLVVRNRKLSQITSTVRRIDPDAFMIITNAHEVLGEGFIAIDPKKTGR